MGVPHLPADPVRSGVFHHSGVPQPGEAIQALLARLRRHLSLEACFVGEVSGGRRIFRFVDGNGETFGITLGADDPSDQTYCQRILEGRIPQIVADAQRSPETKDLPATIRGRIGAHIGVPIVLPSGRVYGTLCAATHEPRPDLDDRDLAFVRLVAEMIGEQLAQLLGPEAADRLRVAARLRDPHGLSIVFQPVVNLRTGTVVGYEALSRFVGAPPEAIFAEAWRTGLGQQLEMKAIRSALDYFDALPEDAWLSLNVGPRTILSPEFEALLDECVPNRLVVEITEHDAVDSYGDVGEALESLLDRGVRLAIDDVGSGYSSLAHIVELSPDILKLDAVFTRGIESELARKALTNAFTRFARDIDATLVVEGIETPEELQALLALGIEFGQGFHLGRPDALESPR